MCCLVVLRRGKNLPGEKLICVGKRMKCLERGNHLLCTSISCRQPPVTASQVRDGEKVSAKSAKSLRQKPR